VTTEQRDARKREFKRDRVRVAIAILLALILLGWGGNLYATYANGASTKQQLENQNAQQLAAQKEAAEKQQAAATAEIQALCHDLGTMAAIAPPAGSPADNPSRAYEQSEHRAWQGLYSSIHCDQVR
jgi:hypothetical protein